MSETVIDLRDTARNLAELAPLIRAGEIITLCDADEPVAEIRPLPPRKTAERRPFGLARGVFTVPDDFDEPNTNIERMFYGNQ